MRIPTIVAIAFLGALSAACDTTGSLEDELPVEYELVRANGRALPAVVDTLDITCEEEVPITTVTEGSLVLSRNYTAELSLRLRPYCNGIVTGAHYVLNPVPFELRDQRPYIDFASSDSIQVEQIEATSNQVRVRFGPLLYSNRPFWSSDEPIELTFKR